MANSGGLNAEIDLGEGSQEAPVELGAFVFVVLEPLKLDDQTELDLRTEP